MARMSYAEHQERHTARWYGVRCARYIELAVFHQQQADAWRALDAGEPEQDDTLIRLWQERSDQGLHDAVHYAQRAAHHAYLSIAERQGVAR
jgi:hypothetical protein